MTHQLIQTRVHGRGGQGVVTAAELIALAAFYEGKESQAFPFFGVERSGAPIMAFARISNHKIKTREQVYHPDYLIIQDDSLIYDAGILSGCLANTKILINSSKNQAEIFQEFKKASKSNKQILKIKIENIYTTPATEIALEFIGRNIVNTVILGALAKHGTLFSLESLKKAITYKLSTKGANILQKNLAATEKIYATS
ncbi:MAG: 2-oxoacid:acceptor oxidoreductase family protein [Candidatus Falkowbacteria bacterium]